MNVYAAVERSEVPPTSTIYPSKLVLKRKRDTITGEITKYKARLVFLGNCIKPDDVPADCYSPTTTSKALTLMLSISTILGWINFGYDITGAFLYADIDKPIYMSLPQQYQNDSKVWQLKKTLYGLPQAPRKFYEHITNHLVSNGYQQCIVEKCMFYKYKGQSKIMMVLHVDDLAATASCQEAMNELSKVMMKLYEISTTEGLTAYTGIHFMQNKNGDVTCTQPKYIKALLEEYELENCKECTTPMSMINDDNKKKNAEAADNKSYRR